MVKHGISFSAYVGQLSRHLSQVLPRAAENSGAAAVHQSRVTTRRLGSAVDLVQSWLKKSSHKKIHENLRNLRRRLGPLRDLDVMLSGLEQYRSDHAAAVRWLEEELAQGRSKERKKLRAVSFPLTNNWPSGPLSKKLDQSPAQLRVFLSRMIPRDFENFSQLADALSTARPGRRQQEIDLHALRISGKRVRYTLEISTAVGAPLPKQIAQQFKQIQDALGAWHDRVVLAQRAMKLAAKRELAMGNRRLLHAVFKLVTVIMADAAAGIDAFIACWPNVRGEISAAVRQLWSKTLRKTAK
jgi:CHAD domain-containing protein